MSEELTGIEETQLEEDKTSEETPKNDEELKTLQAQKEHWREKAEKLEAKAKELEAKIPVTSGGLELEDVFALDGFSKEEKELIVKEAKAKGLPISKAVKDEGTQLAIAGLKEKVAKEKAIPVPGAPQVETADFKSEIFSDPVKHQQFEKEMLQRKTGKANI